VNNKELVGRINKMAAIIAESRRVQENNIFASVDRVVYTGSMMEDVNHRINRAHNSYLVQDFLGNTDNAAYWVGQEIKARIIKIKKDHCGE